MTLSNQWYDRLKFVTLIVLPATATLYLTVAQIWGFPASTEVAATITAIDTFLGALLGLSSKNYEPPKDGVLHVTPENETYAKIETPTEDVLRRGTMTLDVRRMDTETR